MKLKRHLFFLCRFDILRIADDNNRILGITCWSELSGKLVLVTGNYALITFYFYGLVAQYLGFQLLILFTENGMFK